VVLLHASTGSALTWGYQQPALARAGYRVIAYSRRGHAKSESGSPDNPGTAVDDLHNLLTFLGVTGKVHLLGAALGGFVLPDYALSHPDRVASLTFSCSQGGVTEPAFRDKIARVTAPPFNQMPASFRELGPSYRADSPQGVAEWEALEKISMTGPRQPWQRKNRLLWEDFGRIRAPSLVFTGGADLYMPVPLMLEFASHLPGAETAILNEAGHSAHWEQPAAFNALVLDFIRRHPARPA
jgi:pimeloyl-ACP methyl ester carboxylesterase